jgi:hypothetical protein
MKLFTLALITGVLLFSCGKTDTEPKEQYNCILESVVPKGDRKVGLDILDLNENEDFDRNMAFAKDLGIDFLPMHFDWNFIETSPGIYEDTYSFLELISLFAAQNDLKLSLTLRPVDIPGKTVPSDLFETRFNDQQMIKRFELLIDFIFTIVDPDLVLNFQIGNEIDGYDTSNEPATFWNDYGIFLKEITAYFHTNYPGIKTGFTATFDGLTENPERYNTLLMNVDVLGTTYYPHKNGFNVKDPDCPFKDLAELVSHYDTKPIYIQEVGYQTSGINNSSEYKQAEFYCNLFRAWDIHAAQIETLSIVRLNDLSLQSAQESAGPYGLNSEDFIEYLRTLGIRTYENEGKKKQAFDIIKARL